MQPGKIVCVCRNYAEHARELGHALPEQPLLFMKPGSAVADLTQAVAIPLDCGACHHETEICVRLSQALCRASPAQARQAIDGVGLGLDLTLRDLQAQLKAAGHPWERAKAFDGAAVLGPFWAPEQLPALDELEFFLDVDGQRRQTGHSRDMLWGIVDLLSHISHVFRLQPGDVVMSGTPAGVAPLAVGQRLRLGLAGHELHTEVVAGPC